MIVSLTEVLFNIYGRGICFADIRNTHSVDNEYYGKYIGSVEVQWLEDGRRMRLLKSFSYIDCEGVEWLAPVGFVVDGASIPQFFWSLVGGPYEGKYRDASVIHDAACSERKRSWESAHLAFYYAMLASGVDFKTAKLFYAAVYHYGPRWSIKYEENIALSNIKTFVDKVRLEAAIGSQLNVIKEEVSNFGMVKTIVTVDPPKSQLKESDFVKLKNVIEKRESSVKGPMSLEEIRNYSFGE